MSNFSPVRGAVGKAKIPPHFPFQRAASRLGERIARDGILDANTYSLGVVRRIITNSHFHGRIGKVLDEIQKGLQGAPLYLTGGAIRDAALGITPQDLDFIVEAEFPLVAKIARSLTLDPDDHVKVFSRWKKVTIRFGREGRNVEIMALGKRHSLRDRKKSIAKNLLGRDFTCNAVVYDPQSRFFIDAFDGLDDLMRLKRIRAIGNPDRTFKADPRRAYRAVAFSEKYGLTLDPPIERALRNNARVIAEYKFSDMARCIELWRIFRLPNFIGALRRLDRYGFARNLLPIGPDRVAASLSLLEELQPETAAAKTTAAMYFTLKDEVAERLDGREDKSRQEFVERRLRVWDLSQKQLRHAVAFFSWIDRDLDLPWRPGEMESFGKISRKYDGVNPLALFDDLDRYDRTSLTIRGQSIREADSISARRAEYAAFIAAETHAKPAPPSTI